MMKKITIMMVVSVTPAVLYAADSKEAVKKELLEYMELVRKYQAPAKTAEEAYQEDLQKYPMLRLTKEINDAIIHDEAKRFDRASMKARIDAEHKTFQEGELKRCTEVFRSFEVQIERTFQECDPHPVARCVIEGIKSYEKTEKNNAWGFSVIYEWKNDNDGNRLLWCLIRVDPKDIMVVYDKQTCYENS